MRNASARASRRRGLTAGEPDCGAALVEFALLVPLLVILLLGIVEFGVALSQQLDVRHGAREGSRLVAVDHGGSSAALVAETCGRMDLAGDTSVNISLSGAGGAIGDEASVQVIAPLDTVTGFFDALLPSTLSSRVRVRIEQTPSWSNGVFACP